MKSKNKISLMLLLALVFTFTPAFSLTSFADTVSEASVDGVVQQAQESLNNFYVLMQQPELYPDIPRAWLFLNPFLKLVSFFLGLSGIVLVVAVVVSVVVDMLRIMAHRLGIMTDKAWMQKRKVVVKGEEKEIDDIWDYMKWYWWKLILSFACTVLLISGQTLPLAAKTVYSMNTFVNVAMSLDLSTKINEIQDATSMSDALKKTVSDDYSKKQQTSSNEAAAAEAYAKLDEAYANLESTPSTATLSVLKTMLDKYYNAKVISDADYDAYMEGYDEYAAKIKK